jgi:multicomponent Na+:H+ antiporter subunit E
MSLRLALASAVLLALLWLMLAREAAAAVGAVAVAVALWTLARTAAPGAGRLRWARVLPLAAAFLWQSLAGGIDVTRRILAPAMPLAPGLVTLRLALPDEGARVLLALLVSLMPGTLAARLQGDRLTLHVLDLRLPIEAETRRIEHLIARLYDRGEPAR